MTSRWRELFDSAVNAGCVALSDIKDWVADELVRRGECTPVQKPILRKSRKFNSNLEAVNAHHKVRSSVYSSGDGHPVKKGYVLPTPNWSY